MVATNLCVPIKGPVSFWRLEESSLPNMAASRPLLGFMATIVVYFAGLMNLRVGRAWAIGRASLTSMDLEIFGTVGMFKVVEFKMDLQIVGAQNLHRFTIYPWPEFIPLVGRTISLIVSGSFTG